MARYVDAEKAKHEFNIGFGGVSHAVIANQIIDCLPTADVAEVKHGEWKYECLECTICKRNISEICDADSYLTSGIEYELHFCPFCGAKMDGKTNINNTRCNKCINETHCSRRRADCPDYKRDAPDGGYYG